MFQSSSYYVTLMFRNVVLQYFLFQVDRLGKYCSNVVVKEVETAKHAGNICDCLAPECAGTGV